MCEWLSCNQWYDVQLLCGNHIFNAHRAVLASVSKFLRYLLLSRPIEEDSTCITLPDFENEAMILVLNYIYKGEVLISKSKLRMFLEIINALQIFIDNQHLTQISHIMDGACNNLCPHSNVKNSMHNCDEVKMKFAQFQNKQAILKNNVSSLKFPLQQQDEIYSRDKQVNYKDESKVNISKRKFLSTRLLEERTQCDELVKEDYPNIAKNCVIKDVIVRQNEIYHWPTSDLSTKRIESCTKIPIRNSVMRSPWCPQLPHNFQPLYSEKYKVHKETVNDNNNNKEIFLQLSDENKTTENESLHESFTEEKKISTNHDHCNTHDSTKSNNKYSCSECNKKFSQLRNFKYHMSKHRGTREYAATCPICGKYFNDRGYLSSHMKIHRNRKEYKCSMCPKSFNQRVAYNMHLRIHTGVKPHTCNECGKAFSRKILLKQHERTHSGERPYACLHCEKKFSDRSNMTLHLRLHTGEKPFECTECGKSFTKKHHLQSHMNSHTGQKPYSCPKCNLSFTQSSNMRTHSKKCRG